MGVKNLVEEFVFRGYGTRTAMALGLPGHVTPHELVGVVGALWHIPLYALWMSDADLRASTSLAWPLYLVPLVVGVVVVAVVYGEMRKVSWSCMTLTALRAMSMLPAVAATASACFSTAG